MTAEFPLAVHALVYLLHKGVVVSSAELADNICTNPARVRKVMTLLHKAGLAQSCRGKGSGYSVGPECAALTLRAVLDALGEEPVDMGWRSGDIDRECLICSGMGGIMDGIYASLNDACRDRLAEMTVGSICDKLFSKR